MSAEVIMHPRAIESFPRGIDDVEQFWQVRGYDCVLVPGSRFLHVEPKPRDLPPGYAGRIISLFRGRQ